MRAGPVVVCGPRVSSPLTRFDQMAARYDDQDEDGLGWIQAVAMAAKLGADAYKSKREKDKAKRSEKKAKAAAKKEAAQVAAMPQIAGFGGGMMPVLLGGGLLVGFMLMRK